MKILITGGAGFIGTNLIRYIITHTPHRVVNIDKLTYAGNLESLAEFSNNKNYSFAQIDICDKREVSNIFHAFQPDAIMHLAAESHVDRSISKPADFINTNILGTYQLLELALDYWNNLPDKKKKEFRFHHISTDEVYGDLPEGIIATESSTYNPGSPYAASKAGADHLMRAWHRTYELPILISSCSNNYGPFQYPEKFIPLIISNALQGKQIPIYGDGEQIRDWLHVDDHVAALYKVLTTGIVGETYNISGNSPQKNINLVKQICNILDELKAPSTIGLKIHSYTELITHVNDRPGHDKRYALDSSKIKHQLGWQPAIDFNSGLRSTIIWYLENQDWCLRSCKQSGRN